MTFKSISLFITLLAFNSISLMGQTYFDEVLKYRKDTDIEFADSAKSILLAEDRLNFHGLDYFPVDPKFRLRAKFKPIVNGKVVTMKTSGARTPLYKPYGTVSFKMEGKKCKLTLYQMADPSRPQLMNHLLLAFTDKTNGFTTYGGGRYLEYTTDDIAKKMYLDFNYCFNPYCAYTDGYNCVIPPAENALSVPINAGVKKYHD